MSGRIRVDNIKNEKRCCTLGINRPAAPQQQIRAIQEKTRSETRPKHTSIYSLCMFFGSLPHSVSRPTNRRVEASLFVIPTNKPETEQLTNSDGEANGRSSSSRCRPNGSVIIRLPDVPDMNEFAAGEHDDSASSYLIVIGNLLGRIESGTLEDTDPNLIARNYGRNSPLGQRPLHRLSVRVKFMGRGLPCLLVACQRVEMSTEDGNLWTKTPWTSPLRPRVSA